MDQDRIDEAEYRPRGLCWCGCGGKTTPATHTDHARGDVGGQPVKYIRGHATKGRNMGSANPSWRGGRKIVRGYVHVRAPKHPNADGRGYVPEHVMIAAGVLGCALPGSAVVHHVNGNPADNRPSNLVICQDQAYHVLIHRRATALAESGHADWLRCRGCHKLDAPENLRIYTPRCIYHVACLRAFSAAARRRRAA